MSEIVEDKSFDVITYEINHCIDLGYLRTVLPGGKMPTVIFADCEGCLPSVYEQFPSSFTAPEVRLIIYEKDGGTDGRYDKFEKGLEERGFSLRHTGFAHV